MALQLKKCKRCGAEKALIEFHRQSDCAMGRKTLCKTCRSIEASTIRLADPFARIKDKAHYDAHKVAYGITSRKWKAKAGRRYLDQQKRYQEANKAHIAKRMKLWHIKNRSRNLARKSKWRAKNIERVHAYNSLYDKRNSDKHAAKSARRRLSCVRATPAWNNEFFVSEAYILAKLRTKILGFKWNVDHIVPLRSKIVCGLHVHNNLRVIPFAENMSKGNRVWPDMP